jgi:hypothetical protein
MADQTSQAPEDIGAPISYLVLRPGAPVYDRSGDPVGTVEHVLADERQDVFHGLIIKTTIGHRYANGDVIDGMFERAVIVAAPADHLPEPSADPAAQAVEDENLSNQLKRAWDWMVNPR